MSYYNVFPHCHSHLDPGERCDCTKKVQTEDKKKAEKKKEDRRK